MSSVNMPLLQRAAEELNISIDNAAAERFEAYAALLYEWNQKMNLTAVSDPDGIAVTHFADSLTLLCAVNIPEGAKMLDVGAGAGFPSVPLLILRGDIKLTLLDSLNKRLVFLNELLQKLDLKAETLHSRAEDAAHNEKYREAYDIVTARAVSALPSLCEYCLPFVKTGGIFAAMKGPEVSDETRNAANAVEALGGKTKETVPFTLADGSGRNIILIEKISDTPAKYPRQGVKIAKKPL